MPTWHVSPRQLTEPSVHLGLFAGLSLEGTALIERKDANKDFYGSPVPARDILGGRVPPPEVASRLYEIIEAAEVRLCASSESHSLFFVSSFHILGLSISGNASRLKSRIVGGGL